MPRKMWVYSPESRKGGKPNEGEKQRVSTFFQSVIDEFKAKIKPPENKEWNYIADIYTKWFRNCFYICEKWKCDAENRLEDEWERKVIRLKYIDTDKFDFSYMRHTGKWEFVDADLSLEECKDMIMEVPNFQPLF